MEGIEIVITPRIIERAVFSIIIIVLLVLLVLQWTSPDCSARDVLRRPKGRGFP